MEDLRCLKIRNQSIESAKGGGCLEGVVPISRGFSQISSGFLKYVKFHSVIIIIIIIIIIVWLIVLTRVKLK